MPCRTNDGPADFRIYEDHFRHNGAAAELLCSLMKNIEAKKLENQIPVPTNVTLWWKVHKIRDKEKARAETRAKEVKETREKALSKLTLKEKCALGLKPFQDR